LPASPKTEGQAVSEYWLSLHFLSRANRVIPAILHKQETFVRSAMMDCRLIFSKTRIDFRPPLKGGLPASEFRMDNMTLLR
jgi:hypothetical protein